MTLTHGGAKGMSGVNFGQYSGTIITVSLPFERSGDAVSGRRQALWLSHRLSLHATSLTHTLLTPPCCCRAWASAALHSE